MTFYKIPVIYIKKENKNCFYDVIDDIIVKKNSMKVQEIKTGYHDFYWLQEKEDSSSISTLCREYSSGDFTEAEEGEYLVLLGNEAEEASPEMITDYMDEERESFWLDFYRDILKPEEEEHDIVKQLIHKISSTKR